MLVRLSCRRPGTRHGIASSQPQPVFLRLWKHADTRYGLKSMTKITLFYNSRRTLRKSICSLLLPHGVVETVRQHEFLVRSLLDDRTVLEYND